jgi:hypothetical protein
MRFRTSGRPCVSAIAAAIVVAAGCSSAAPTPQTYIAVTLNPTGGKCPVNNTTPLISIGSMGTVPANDNPTRVADGGIVHVSCTVKGSSPNFSVQVAAKSDSSVSGMGGTVEISGEGIMSTHGSNTGGANITGTFAGDVYGTYAAQDCTLTYSYNGTANIGGIAPGRLWAHVSCPDATNGAITVDANGDPATCDVEADVIFENCGS